tara:strand:+ start:30184 stop:30348 length:165 start_codon:yes stop_codon:yes gene_type:complete
MITLTREYEKLNKVKRVRYLKNKFRKGLIYFVVAKKLDVPMAKKDLSREDDAKK